MKRLFVQNQPTNTIEYLLIVNHLIQNFAEDMEKGIFSISPGGGGGGDSKTIGKTLIKNYHGWVKVVQNIFGVGDQHLRQEIIVWLICQKVFLICLKQKQILFKHLLKFVLVVFYAMNN